MKLADKKVLVTGDAGFIGSHLVKRLLNLGAEVFPFYEALTPSKRSLSTPAD